jgi:hypothetical protein
VQAVAKLHGSTLVLVNRNPGLSVAFTLNADTLSAIARAATPAASPASLVHI